MGHVFTSLTLGLGLALAPTPAGAADPWTTFPPAEFAAQPAPPTATAPVAPGPSGARPGTGLELAFDGPVTAMTADAARVYVAGHFLRAGPASGPVGRLGRDGAPLAVARFDGPIVASAPAPGGGRYVVGPFTTVDDLPRPGVARLTAAGALDATFAPEAAIAGPRDVAVAGTRVVVLAGDGVVVHDAATGAVAGRRKLLASGRSGGADLRAIVATASGAVVVGGAVTHLDLQPTGTLTALDPVTLRTIPGFAPPAIDTVERLAMAGGRLVVTGRNAEQARRVWGLVAATGGLTWERASGTVTALAADGDRVLLGGDGIPCPSATTCKVSALSPATGEPLAGFAAAPPGTVRALTRAGDHVVVSTGAEGADARTLRRLDAITGADDAGFAARPIGAVRHLAPVGDGVLLSDRELRAVSSLPRAGLAAVGHGASALDPFAPVVAGGVVEDLVADGDRLLLAGSFISVGGGTRPRLAAVRTVDGTPDVAFTPATALPPTSLSVGGGTVYTAEGRNLRAYDLGTGATRSAFLPAPDGQVDVVLAAHGRVYAAGSFRTIGGEPRARLAAVDPATGALVRAFAPPTGTDLATALAADATRLFWAGFDEASTGALPGVRAYAAVDGARAPLFGTGLGPIGDGRSVAIDGDDVLFGTGRRLLRLDPATGASRVHWAQPRGETRELAVAPGALWAVGVTGSGPDVVRRFLRAADRPAPLGPARIDAGVAGDELRCVPPAFADPLTATAFRWSRDGRTVGAAATYTPDVADLRAPLRCSVLAEDADGRTVVTSAPEPAVRPALRDARAPVVEGTPAVGRELTCRAPYDAPVTVLRRQWTRDGEPVRDASWDRVTGATMTVTDEDVGHRLGCVMEQELNAASIRAVGESAEHLVTAAAPRALAPPWLGGVPEPGGLLGCAIGLWTPEPDRYAITWTADGTPATAEPGGRLRVTSAMAGRRITCAVTATSGAGSTTVAARNAVRVRRP